MTINEMFNMAKGQTLTQDGCEADVDDKRYNIGDISQKTGLQKTANGWVKPRSGKAPGAKTGPGETPEGKGNPAGEKWKENTDYLGRKRISMETPQGGKVSIYESENPKQKNARFRVDTGDHYNEFNTIEEAKAFAEEHYGVKNDPKLAKEIENMNHFEESKKAAQSAKREEARKADRREGEARAEDFRKNEKKQDFSVLTKMKFRWDERDDGKEGFLLEDPRGSQVFVDEKDVSGGYPNYTIKPGSAIHEALNLFNIPFNINVGEAGGNITKVTDPQSYEESKKNYRPFKNAKKEDLEYVVEQYKKHPPTHEIARKQRDQAVAELAARGAEDSAPRILTKDTKIRVRKA